MVLFVGKSSPVTRRDFRNKTTKLEVLQAWICLWTFFVYRFWFENIGNHHFGRILVILSRWTVDHHFGRNMYICELFASFYQQANLRDLDNMYRENQWKDRLRHHKQIRLIDKDLKHYHSTFFLGSSYYNDSYVPSNLKWFSNHHPAILGVVVVPIVSQSACLFLTTLWFWGSDDGRLGWLVFLY